MAQAGKSLTTVQETQVQSLEKEVATHSSVLAWRIPWTEEPGRYSLGGRKELDMKCYWRGLSGRCRSIEKMQ